MRIHFDPTVVMQAIYARMAREQLTVTQAAQAMQIDRRTFYRVQQAAENGEGYTRWNPTLEKMRVWAYTPPKRRKAPRARA